MYSICSADRCLPNLPLPFSRSGLSPRQFLVAIYERQALARGSESLGERTYKPILNTLHIGSVREVFKLNKVFQGYYSP